MIRMLAESGDGPFGEWVAVDVEADRDGLRRQIGRDETPLDLRFVTALESEASQLVAREKCIVDIGAEDYGARHANPHAGLLAAADPHQSDSGQLRNLLRERRVRQVFDLRQRERL